MMTDDIERVLLSEEELNAAVSKVAAQISKDFEGKNPLIVSVLKGSFVFMADLTRKITIPATIDFMALSSYSNKAKSSGEVRILKDLSVEIKNRHIIIVEDILDSGLTLNYTINMLKTREPASITLCTLLDKPQRRTVDIKPQYSCFSVCDEFVVGYGLDYNEYYRNLPYIGVLKPSVYGGKE